MYKEVSLNDGVDIFEEIKKQVKKSNNANIEFNFDQHDKIMNICNICVEEIKHNSHKINQFIIIASLCNALSIFPISQDKKINTEIMVSLMLEMTSKVNKEIELKTCDENLKIKIINKIIKIQKDPRVSPYNLGCYLQQLYNQNSQNKHLVK